jgi:hypothetical protein
MDLDDLSLDDALSSLDNVASADGCLVVEDDGVGTPVIPHDGKGALLIHNTDEGDLVIHDDEEVLGDVFMAEDDPYEGVISTHSDAEGNFIAGAPLHLDAAFNQLLNERAAVNAPLLPKKKEYKEKREFPLDTGPVFGPAGESVVVTLTPQCFFHATKVIATDSATPAGNGTRITMINVGQRVQRMGAGGTLTAFFPAVVLGNGVDFDTNEPYEQIQITVSFIQTCTFELSLFGEAVI